MDSFAARYSGWDLTLQITQSKFGLEGSSITGVQSTFLTPFTKRFNSNSQPFWRCESLPENMVTGVGHQRMHKKTDYLVKKFDSRTLWDTFGIYEDVVVHNDVHECFQG
jgi:hypothetical protein